MFGSSDKPVDEEDGDEFQGHDIGDAVNAVIHRRPRRTESGDNEEAGQAGWRLRNWRRHAGAPSPSQSTERAGGGPDSGRHVRSQTSFRGFFNRNKKSGINLEATLDEELAELDDDGAGGGNNHRRAATSAAPRLPPRGSRATAQPRRSPVRPQGISADSAEGGIVDLGDVKGGKLKAAVKRAMVASRREKEAAARRGRQRKRQEEELGEFNGYIQVKDPALDKICVEYGLTEDLAEAKYRYVWIEISWTLLLLK